MDQAHLWTWVGDGVNRVINRLTGEFAFDVTKLHEAISLRLKLWVINIGAREVAAESGEVRHEFKYGGELLPLDVHAIATIYGPGDGPAHHTKQQFEDRDSQGVPR